MRRDRLRLAGLARRVLLPPLLLGAATGCLLVVFAVAGGDQRAKANNPLAGERYSVLEMLVTSVDLEGALTPADIRRARKPLSERNRMLAQHPYVDLYRAAKRRFGVPWFLVASIHYQETAFRKRRDDVKLVMAIASGLKAAGGRDLGANAMRATAARYGGDPKGRLSTAMVVERARAWKLLGTLPLPGRGELLMPVKGVVGGCGYFGCPRPGHLHNGVDFLAPTGTPVRAAEMGRVAVLETSEESSGYGNFACIQHRPHLASCYAHLNAVAAGVKPGATVARGQVIGSVGSTGSSSAPHLHFEVRRGPAECSQCAVDPLPLLSGEVPQTTVPELPTTPAATTPAKAPAPAPVAAQAVPLETSDRTPPAEEPAPVDPLPPIPPKPRPKPVPATAPPPPPATREPPAPEPAVDVATTPQPPAAPEPQPPPPEGSGGTPALPPAAEPRPTPTP